MRHVAGFLCCLALVTPALAQSENQRAAPDYLSRARSRPAAPDAEAKAILSRPIDGRPQPRPVIVPAPPGTTAWRLTRRNGYVYLISQYIEEGKFFVVLQTSGARSSHLIESVARIEPLTRAELDAAMANDESPTTRGAYAARTSARTSPRTSARTTARAPEPPPAPAPVATAAPASDIPSERIEDIKPDPPRTYGANPPRTYRAPAPDPTPPPPVEASSSSLGTTPTGIPLHMGPRGGIFHYSKSGKKVYQRKK
jgi:hypothetical protein